MSHGPSTPSSSLPSSSLTLDPTHGDVPPSEEPTEQHEEPAGDLISEQPSVEPTEILWEIPPSPSGSPSSVEPSMSSQILPQSSSRPSSAAWSPSQSINASDAIIRTPSTIPSARERMSHGPSTPSSSLPSSSLTLDPTHGDVPP
ncbi:MAG: hypothetical protein ACK56F_06430, partial [bacterium]